VSTKLSLFGFKPLAAAKSSLRVHNNSADHRQINRSNTRPNPAHIKKCLFLIPPKYHQSDRP
jgi:hypothetical protein